MEDGVVTISRAKGSVTYPAKFLLVTASNPCPCGYYGDAKKACTCLPGMVLRYQKRVSGPILDRIDIHIDVPSVETQKLISVSKVKSETSKSIQARVQTARNLQIKRFKGLPIKSNSEMTTRDVKNFCELSEECRILLTSAVSTINLSARSYFKVIKVARTIADLSGEKDINGIHIAEALQYRPKVQD
jgi:magnesium chelatase family protein